MLPLVPLRSIYFTFILAHYNDQLHSFGLSYSLLNTQRRHASRFLSLSTLCPAFLKNAEATACSVVHASKEINRERERERTKERVTGVARLTSLVCLAN